MGTERESEPPGAVVSPGAPPPAGTKTDVSLPRHAPGPGSAGGPAVRGRCTRADPAAGPPSLKRRRDRGCPEGPRSRRLPPHLAQITGTVQARPARLRWPGGLPGREVVWGALSVGGVR